MEELTAKEIEKLRAETGGTGKKIHFNNAGASLPPDIVVQTVIDYLSEEALNGGYETEAKYAAQLEHVYDQIAALINAGKDEIAIVENASTAWSLAFNGLTFEKGDVILTTEMEYVTNLIGLQIAKTNYGIEVVVVLNDEHGNFSLTAFEKAISPKTRLIAVTHIPSASGNILPVVEIGAIAKKHKILYLVDACQSAGQVPLNVKEINCDMLSVTGRKYLRAPRGTGFLFVRKEIQDQFKLFVADGFTAQTVSQQTFTPRNDARRFELYESSRALKLGLGAAVEYALNLGLERIWDRVKRIAYQLRSQLQLIEGVSVHDTGDQKCGIVTFSLAGFDNTVIKDLLFEKNINVSLGTGRSTLIYMEKHHLPSVLRASLHYYNTEKEIDVFCEELKSILSTSK